MFDRYLLLEQRIISLFLQCPQRVYYSIPVIYQNRKSMTLIQKREFKLSYIDKDFLQIKGKMDINQSQEFHHFIEISATRTKQAEKFPEFQYMEKTIRTNYKLVKKSKGDKTARPSKTFSQFFKSLQKQKQIKFYERQINILQNALKESPQLEQRQNQFKEGTIQIQNGLLKKWQPKQVKLQDLSFCIKDKKQYKPYPLKYYQIRKSKNKDFCAWVLQLINGRQGQHLKTLTCGVKNIKQYQNWFQIFKKQIDVARRKYYCDVLRGVEPTIINGKGKFLAKSQLRKTKTLTELMVDNQMKNQDQMEQIQEEKQSEDNESQKNDRRIDEYMKEEKMDTVLQGRKSEQVKLHPNVFVRLFPKVNLETFSVNNNNMTILQNGKGYRLFDVHPQEHQDIFKLRINVMLPYHRSLVFKALSEENNLWNKEIDNFTIKTKISSQNSVLIYQKDKAQGLLYRERDYLFLRHCFSQKSQNSKQKDKIIIADKSIDSVNIPPFMKITRGQKQLIWCICANQEDKQSMLILEGWIIGGGYMNRGQNKDMTIKFFKQVLQLSEYLKEQSFMEGSQKQHLFEEKWQVQPFVDDEFYDIPDQDNFETEPDSSMEKRKHSSSENQNVYENQDEDKFSEFIKRTSENNIDSKDQDKVASCNSELTFSKVFPYKPPQFAQDQTIVIPTNYLHVRHQITPLQKKQPQLFPHYRGHHLWKGQWAICPAGGLNYVDQQKMDEQRKVLTFIIKRIGRNILSGKGILNISLPVDIFTRESNIERLAASFAYAPRFLQKASTLDNSAQQIKYIVATANFSSLIYLTMQKPFNPILGQTYQSWIDGCPVYFQQISHHPPIASYLMIGRGYRLSGTLQAKMQISINSGTGINEGIFTVEFDSGKKFYYTTAAGQLSGLTYGQRKLLLVGKTFYWQMQEGLFLELTFNPSAKKRGFFGGNGNITGDAQFHDYIEGTLKKYNPKDLEEHLVPKKGDFRKKMAIPKGAPPTAVQPISQFYKVAGRWNKYISFDGQKTFNVDQDRYFTMKDQENPLPSHSNYRQDVVYRRMNDFVPSQQFKEVLEVKQRKDRKLREAEEKKKNKK